MFADLISITGVCASMLFAFEIALVLFFLINLHSFQKSPPSVPSTSPPFLSGFCWRLGYTPSPEDPTRDDPLLDTARFVNWARALGLSKVKLVRTRFIREGLPVYHVLTERCYLGTGECAPKHRFVHRNNTSRVHKTVWLNIARGRFFQDAYFGLGEDIFSDSPQKSAILSPLVGRYLNHHRTALRDCPHRVPAGRHKFLRRAGLTPPAEFSTDHVHPIHEALENMHLRVVNDLLRGKNWYSLWLRSEKESLLSTPPIDRFNPVMVSKDVRRFRSTPSPDTPSPTSKAPIWFAHDVLHNLSPSEVGSWFDRHRGLKYLLATIVAPVESSLNAPSVYPDLYNLSYWWSWIKYTPEDDEAGSYIQPRDAHRWATSSRLVTPQGECLHMGLLASRYAHHVVLVSRPQVLETPLVVTDFPQLMMVPQWAMPFSSPAARLTSPRIVNKLFDFSSSFGSVGWKEVYTKLRQFQMVDAELLPPSYKIAAATYVLAHRASGWMQSYSTCDWVSYQLGFALRLPFVPLTVFYYSVANFFRPEVLPPHNYFNAPPEILVSSPSDIRVNLETGLCDLHQLPLDYIPPSTGWFGRFWIKHAAVMKLLVAKFVGVFLFETWPRALDLLRWFWDQFLFRFEVSWTTPLVACFSMFISVLWSQSSDPSVVYLTQGFHCVGTWVVRSVRFTWGMLWGLPAVTRWMPVGYTWRYKVLILWLWYTTCWPYLLYPFFSARGSATQSGFGTAVAGSPSSLPYGLFALLFVPFALVRGNMRAAIRDRHPHHLPVVEDCESEYGTARGTPFSERSSLISDSPASYHTAESIPSTTYFSLAPSPLLLALDQVRPDTPATFATVLTSLPVNQPSPPAAALPLPVQHPAPVLPMQIPQANPYLAWALTPAAFPTSESFAATMRLLPLPPNFPPWARMCVWDCIGTVLGLDPVLVWANFMAISPHAQYVVNGSVQHDILPSVFAHFQIHATVYPSSLNGQLAETHATQPPHLYGVPTPGWPVVTWSLVDNPNDPGVYHLITAPPVISGNAQPAAPQPGSLVGKLTRFVSLGEMRFALNVPIMAYMRIYNSLTGWGPNPAAGAAFANSQVPEPAQPPPGLPPPVVLPVIPLVAEHLNYRISAQDLSDGRALVSDLTKYPQHMHLADVHAGPLAHSMDALLKHAQPRDCDLTLWHGMPGTGKTTAFVNEINQLLQQGINHYDIAVLCFSDLLRDELMESFVNQTGLLSPHSFPVGYRIFAHGARYVFVDDAGMFPPGFLQALMCTNVHVDRWFYTFDCAQSTTVFPEPATRSRLHTPTRKWLSAMSNHYATQVRRMSRDNCDLFGVPALTETRGDVVTVSQPPTDLPLLVASPRFAETKSAGGTETYSFSTVQGMTFAGDVAIDLGGLSNTTTDASMWTTLTRCRGRIWLVLPRSFPATTTLQECSFGTSVIVSAVLAVAAQRQSAVVNAPLDIHQIVARAVQSHLARSLSPQACAQLGLQAPSPVVAGFTAPNSELLRGIARWGDSSDHAYTTPRTHASKQAPVQRRRKGFDFKGTRFDKAQELTKMYLPMTIDSKVSALPSNYVPLPREPQEISFDPLVLEDVHPRSPDEEQVGPTIEPTNVRDEFGPREAQHHRGSDNALYEWTIPQRTPARRDSTRMHVQDHKRLRQLKAGFQKSLPLPQQEFNELLFEDCIVSALHTWFSGKTITDIKAAIASWDVDETTLFYKIFLKGQWIKKLEARGANVKKGQIITRVPLYSVFMDAVHAVYLERVLRNLAPSSTLLFSGMDPSQLQSWYSSNWTPGAGITGNDYTGWDTGVDLVFLEFDKWLLSRVGLPAEYIERYFFQRTNARTHVGPFPIMQASGDRFTWILNTARNLALVGASLNFPSGTPVAVCGDDSIVQGIWSPARGFVPRAWKMVPKLFTSRTTGDFCAWRFGQETLSMSTAALAYRLRIAIQRRISNLDYWHSAVESALLVRGDPEQLGAVQFYINDAIARFQLPMLRFDFASV
jgi:hypothetical protein